MMAPHELTVIIKTGLEKETVMSHVLQVGLLPPIPDQQKELDSRVVEDETSPADVTTWDEIKSDALKRWRP